MLDIICGFWQNGYQDFDAVSESNFAKPPKHAGAQSANVGLRGGPREVKMSAHNIHLLFRWHMTCGFLVIELTLLLPTTISAVNDGLPVNSESGSSSDMPSPWDPVLKRIDELCRQPVDYKTAVEWFNLSKSIDNTHLRQELLMTVGAALIYSNCAHAYSNAVKTLLFDTECFENEFTICCANCGGKGKTVAVCQICNGNGQCGNCSNGKIAWKDKNDTNKGQGLFRTRYFNCARCSGTGKCPKCHGEGALYTKCSNCDGKGVYISQGKVLQCYRKHAVQASELCLQKENQWQREAEDRKRRDERHKLEALELQARRKKAIAAEEIALMQARGLVLIGGKWMTPGSVVDMEYRIEKVVSTYHAICTDLSGRYFCLLLSDDDRSIASDGNNYADDLYRCGIYNYKTGTSFFEKSLPIPKFAKSLELAEKEISRDKMFNSK